jgi:biopolymer transport protein ExbB
MVALLLVLLVPSGSHGWQGEVPPTPDFAGESPTASETESAPPLAPDDGTPSPDPLFPTDGAATADSEEGTREEEKDSVFDILGAGGIIGFFIILLSVGAVALMIEHAITIRSNVLMPPGLSEEVHDLLKTGQWARALDRCRSQPSFLGYVLDAAISEVEAGWSSVEKSFEDSMAEQSSRLFRKIEYLSVIGNIAPMLGLLGTVVGMILAFRDLADSDGYSRASDLAEGIYLALITTVEGLIVAIPSLAAFAIFRNRVDALVAEVTFVADRVLHPVKKKLLVTRGAKGTGAPPVTTPPASRKLESKPPRRSERTRESSPEPKRSDTASPPPPPGKPELPEEGDR